MNRINLIAVGVKNIGASLKFYKSIGFKTYGEDENPPIVFFDNDGSKLELYPLEDLAKDINQDNPPKLSEGGFSGITFAYNVKSEKEVDDTMKLVENAGGKIAKKPQKTFWDGYSGYFQDVDGYYWEVAYSKDWKFDKNDMLIIE